MNVKEISSDSLLAVQRRTNPSGEKVVVKAVREHRADEDEEENVAHAEASLKDVNLYYNIMGRKEMQGGGRMELASIEISGLRAAEEALRSVGADPRGVEIMKEKAVFRVVRVKDVPVRAANLVKQAFLAHGAEAAVSRETAAFAAETTDVVLMGTLAQYRAILPRLREQPFGLRSLSEALEKFLWENS